MNKARSNEDESVSIRAIADYGSSLLPLMDVIFILLFFLMLVASEKATEAQLDIELPRIVEGHGARPEDRTAVSLTRGGIVYCEGVEYTSVSSFGGTSAGVSTDVVLRVDGEVAYQRVLDLIGVVKQLGAERVALAGEEIRAGAQRPE